MARNTFPFLKRYIQYNSFVRRFYQVESTYRIIVNSVPKSGTHLLMRALELASGIERAPIQFGRQRIELLPWCIVTCPSIRSVILSQYYSQNHILNSNGVKNVPIDSDSPFFLTEIETREIFRLIQPGWFAMGHLPRSQSIEKIIEQEEVKMILIIRDPRDVIVSHAHYLAKKRSHYMYPLYKSLSKKDRITVSMSGISEGPNYPRLLNIRDRLEGIIAWMNHKNTYTTYFESLIGPQGYGTRTAQIGELRAITDHLNLSITDVKLSAIADGMYGGTRTFRSGTSGGWQSSFDEGHRQTCKELIGDLLIELGYEKDYDW